MNPAAGLLQRLALLGLDHAGIPDIRPPHPANLASLALGRLQNPEEIGDVVE